MESDQPVPPSTSPSYASGALLGVGVAAVFMTVVLAWVANVQVAGLALATVMLGYGAARLALPDSGRYEGLAVRSKVLDVSFSGASGAALLVLSLTTPNLV